VIKVKQDALRIIRDDLNRKIKRGVVATGAMSDPYNPLEQELKLTRNALELINAYQFGVAIDTKSDLVIRDTESGGISKTANAFLICSVSLTRGA
jgi:DNA repair photolyase